MISNLLFLFTQMQKEDSIDRLLSFLAVDLTKLLRNTNARKQNITDLAKNILPPIYYEKMYTPATGFSDCFSWQVLVQFFVMSLHMAS